MRHPAGTSLLGRAGWRRTFGRELQHGNELLQSEFEDLGNFQQRVAFANGVQDLNQRRVGSANHPDFAAFSLPAFHCRAS